ncbi:MAG: 30S ribosomal protein S18 [Anaerolineae bacterium]|nr:30S ribosomal protein S18 [Anaerolineae bacterium]
MDNRENNQDNRGGSQRQRSFQRNSGGGRSSSRFRSRRRRVCAFCADKNKVLDWKKADDLRRYVGDSGEILPRRKNGLCARHQRSMAVAIKRARHLALLPYTNDHIRIMSHG